MKVRRTRQRPSGFRCRKEKPPTETDGGVKRRYEGSALEGRAPRYPAPSEQTMKSPASGGKAGGARRGVTAHGGGLGAVAANFLCTR